VTLDRLVPQLAREATLATRVEQELERLIIESRLGAGERLPSERELASQFGVSRTVVREAVRALAAKQLVDVNVGRGTVVRAPSAKAAAESMKLLLLMQADGAGVQKVSEIRHIIENEIAALAASRRTEDDLRRLDEILAEMRAHVDAPEVYIKSDVEFHAVLAEATQNELFVIVLDSLVEIMIEVRLLTLRVPGIARLALHYHERILDAVRSGDSEAARAIMDEHMDQATAKLMESVVADPE
jgi:GntR family transcriptional regulator, transcriptional repressor for pyruvate dehydrogenase complex